MSWTFIKGKLKIDFPTGGHQTWSNSEHYGYLTDIEEWNAVVAVALESYAYKLDDSLEALNMQNISSELLSIQQCPNDESIHRCLVWNSCFAYLQLKYITVKPVLLVAECKTLFI